MIMIKIKIEKKKMKWMKWKIEQKRKRRKQVRKKVEKKKISCLAKNRHAFEKRQFPTFLWKNSFIDHNRFLKKKKRVYTWRVNAVKISPDAQTGLGWMHKLIKEHILETLGWFKIEEMNPEP